MARTIELTGDALRLRYSGWLRFFLGREVVVPYAGIESVEPGLRELPSMSRNMRRRVNRGKIIRGRFRDGDRRWYLFDWRHRDRAVTIVMLPSSGRYTALMIEPDEDPETFAAELRSRL